MRNTAARDESAALRREIATAMQNTEKHVARHGRDYALFGYSFDAAIADKRAFAVEWRKWVLEVADGRPIESRSLTVYGYDGESGESYKRVYKVFSSNGRDVAAVYAKGGSNCLGRFVKIASGSSAEETLRRDGWRA